MKIQSSNNSTVRFWTGIVILSIVAIIIACLIGCTQQRSFFDELHVGYSYGWSDYDSTATGQAYNPWKKRWTPMRSESGDSDSHTISVGVTKYLNNDRQETNRLLRMMMLRMEPEPNEHGH